MNMLRYNKIIEYCFSMSEDSEGKASKESNEVLDNSEINLQFHWYLFSFFLVYIGSLLIPGIIFLFYFVSYFMPLFLEAENFFVLFLNLQSFLTFLLMPLVIIFCYCLRLFLIALITRVLWAITEKKSPSKDGVIPRNIPSKILNYYHIRSFLIKYPKNVFVKGIFPWLTNWLYNFVKTNEIGKGTTVEEQVCADKYVQIGENSYIGVNSVLTSHLVEGIFGNTIYFKLKVGDNVTLGGWNCFASGTEINDNSYLMPSAHGGKHYIVKGNNIYFGMPLRKIFKKKIASYLGLSIEDLNKNEKLAKLQQTNKKIINSNK